MPLRILAFLLCIPAVFSQVRISEHIDNQRRVRLPGNRHPLAVAANENGVPSPDISMERMLLVLAAGEAQQQDLDELLRAQQDPTSPQYQQWLTPEEFGSRFGVAESDLARVKHWLEDQGFSVDEIPAGRRTIVFTGTAAQVNATFHTEMRHYRISGRTHLANATDVEIPQALAGVVKGISTLHDFGRQPLNLGRLEPLMNASSAYHYLSPADFATIYDVNALYTSSIDGAGQTIAVVARCNINVSDVTKFRSMMGLPANDPAIVLTGADPGIYNQGEATEALLDVEWAGAIARKAAVKLVVSKSTGTTDGVDLSAQYIVNRNLAPVMTTSFGNCEYYIGSAENLFWNNLYQQAAAQGITVFVSSGDSGAAGCDGASAGSATHGRAVNGLASTPYNVAVGGTQFNDTQNPGLYWSASNNVSNYSSALSYIPEAAWNESSSGGLWSSGGGASILYPKPSWQAGTGVPADGHRDVPDVSLTAAGHVAYLVVQNGGLYAVGGTSASSPAFASLMALVLQQSNARQGNANPRLYSMAAQQASGGASVFHDITSGNNSVPGVAGFNAAAGFDLVTGLGSVDAFQMVTRWNTTAAKPDFQITPAASSLSLPVGKSATLAMALALSNGFNSAVALSIGTLPAGLTAGFAPSSIAAPGAGTSTLTLTSATTAAAGTYNLTVTATGGALTHSFTVPVTIAPAPNLAIAATTETVTVVAGTSASTPVTVSVTGGFTAAVSLGATTLPTGLSATYSPATLAAPGSGSSNFTLAASLTALPGTYSITLAASGGGLVKSTTLSVKIAAPPSLSLGSDVAKLSVTQGAAATTRILTSAVNGFGSAVTFAAKGMPIGLTVGFAPSSLAAPGTGASTLTVTAAASVPAGVYNLVITATGGGLAPTLTLPITVVVPPSFTFTSSASAMNVPQGGATSLTETIAVAGGFQSAVSFSVLGLVSGMTATFSPASLASPGNGSSTLTITAAASVASGSRSLYITASGGGLTKTIPVTVTVTTPPLVLVPTASSVILNRGGSIPIGLTVKIASSTTAPVRLTLAGAPSGLTGVFTPSTFTSGGSYPTTLQLSAAPSMAKGTWTVSVSATDGVSIFAIPMVVTVQ